MNSGRRDDISSAKSTLAAVCPPTWASAPDDGMTLVADVQDQRPRCASSCGEVVGVTTIAAAWPDALGITGLTDSTPGVAARPRGEVGDLRLAARVRRVGDDEQRAVAAGAEAVGQPGRRPCAWCCPSGRCPSRRWPGASPAPARPEASRTAKPPKAKRLGWRWTKRLQRCHIVSVRFIDRRRCTDNWSMWLPAKPSSAGSRVSAATTATSTAVDVPMARPWKNDMPISNMPSREMTTVQPAKATARPAVPNASTIACSAPSPRWRAVR